MIHLTTAATALMWLVAMLLGETTSGFSTVSPTNNIRLLTSNGPRMTADATSSAMSSSGSDAARTAATQNIPLFDFSDPTLNATNKFERIDDVIMGGISSSLLRQAEGEEFARWSGVCRTDGGYVNYCCAGCDALSTILILYSLMDNQICIDLTFVPP